MEKVDLKKRLKKYYSGTAKHVAMVDVPAMNFLMIDGHGNPNTAQDYSDAIEALYTVSYILKFTLKKGPTAIDYGVLPLESLSWTDDMTQVSPDNKDIWKWTTMIMQPEWITADLVDEARQQEISTTAATIAVRIVLRG